VNKILHDLDEYEIIALLAIFIEPENKKNSDMSNHIFANNVKINNKIKKITKIIEDYETTELTHNVIHETDYWSIYTDFVEIAYTWSHDTKCPDDIYIGNFIKNMIKINNIANDIICLCKIFDDISIIPVLEKIESKIIKEFVNLNSLYLL